METAQKDIKTFIASMVDKNYSDANSSLHKTIENKIKEQIRQSVDQKKSN
jgi:hypothetical protein